MSEKFICSHEQELIDQLKAAQGDPGAHLLFRVCNINGIYEKKGDGVDYGFIEGANGALYIFFEPSDGKEDWRNNFAYWRRPYKEMDIGYRVHGGFLRCWKTVDDIVIAKVTEIGADGHYKWKSIYVVGYSHGGALAALCHECIWYHRPDLRAEGLEGYGFEAPRIFAGFFMKKELKERWAHFTVYRNNMDIVTHLPPLVFGFRHVGKMVKIKTSPKVGLIDSHRRTYVRTGLGEILDIKNELWRERTRSKDKSVCVCEDFESEK